MMTRAECARWLASRDGFLILTHGRPDGDTVGCSAALCLALRKLGKSAFVLENEEMIDKYAPLHENLTQKEPKPGDILVSVDVSAPHLLPPAALPLAEKIQLRIDHHYTSTSFAPNELVDSAAAACTEIIYDVICELGVALDEPIARALYTGTATDSGCFRYSSTSAHTHLVAAACMEAGLDAAPINLKLFDTVSLNSLRMQAWAIENTRFLLDGRVALCPMPKDTKEKLGIPEEEGGNLSGFLRSIEGVCMAATVRETEEGVTMISMRSLPGFDSSAVCALFGGGGHKAAAGGHKEAPYLEVADEVGRAMCAAVEQAWTAS